MLLRAVAGSAFPSASEGEEWCQLSCPHARWARSLARGVSWGGVGKTSPLSHPCHPIADERQSWFFLDHALGLAHPHPPLLQIYCAARGGAVLALLSSAGALLLS